MTFEDLPLLRHLPFFTAALKATALVAGLFLLPALALAKTCAALRARGAARWYHGMQALAWACAADAYCLPVLALLGNLAGYPAIADARNWPFVLGLFTDRSGTDLLLHETLLQATVAASAFALSRCIGKELDCGAFVPRVWSRSAPDA